MPFTLTLAGVDNSAEDVFVDVTAAQIVSAIWPGIAADPAEIILATVVAVGTNLHAVMAAV